MTYIDEYDLRTGRHTYPIHVLPAMGHCIAYSWQDGPGPAQYVIARVKLDEASGKHRVTSRVDVTREQYRAALGCPVYQAPRPKWTPAPEVLPAPIVEGEEVAL